ncbi:uncharacterized protein SRS1_21027 [Sporisorium reilianum f. sp. reilianum]|uniref:Uncharacterized protein n=1 Tax=Sporisorium reilianum f. sp. reilianum TaxID=72559 RepID=A0A2N8ULP1_9BASI|nr:uncharacterized protein SRS1_21027 [Sporisorium reilianum f. sp. reilianum]
MRTATTAALAQPKRIHPTVCTDVRTSCTTSSIRSHFTPPSPTTTTATRTQHASRGRVWTRVGWRVCDWSWRAWYAFSATCGVSVMQPWERVLALLLVGVVGMGLVSVTFYGYCAVMRAVRVLAHSTVSSTATGEAVSVGSAVAQPNASTAFASARQELDLNMCRLALASGLLSLVPDNGSDVGTAVGKVVGMQ